MGTIIEIAFVIIVLIILAINLTLIRLAKKLKQVENKSGFSGIELTKIICNKISKNEPHIIKKTGRFLDYYDNGRNVVKLSPEVFDGTDIFAGIVALNTALETSKEKETIIKKRNLNNYIVMISYLLIIIGAFLNNASTIHLGFILFIIAFVLEFFTINVYGKTKEEIDELYKKISKENVIKPFDEYKKYIAIILLLPVARLPYSFINNFR